jgi:hypothetical protein
LRRPQGVPPSIELTCADAVQPRNVRGRCPGGQALSRDLRWPPKTGQVAKRESQLGMAVWPKVRHGKYTEEAQS